MRLALVTGWEPSVVAADGEAGVVEAIFRKPIDLPAILRFLDGGMEGKNVPLEPQPASNGR